jgi:hypothetical protein
MDLDVDRRTVLKGVGGGLVGSAVTTGTAGAHGGGGRDLRLPSWFETQLWEMSEVPPHGPEPTDHHSHAPIWQIAPDAGDQNCAQIPGIVDFSLLEGAAGGGVLAEDEWSMQRDSDGNLIPGTGVYMDHTLAADPFSTLWHVHFVFDSTESKPYSPCDLVNEGVGGVPLTNGPRIRNAEQAGLVTIESVPFVFNCPIRPNHGDHYIRPLCSGGNGCS